MLKAEKSKPAEIVILLQDGNDDPVIGLLDTDVELFLLKAGEDTFEEKTLDAMNFEEILAGYYKITLDEDDTDTKGQMIAYIPENMSVQRHDFVIEISDMDDKIARILGLSQENFRITDYQYNAQDNLTSARLKIYTSAENATDMTNAIAEYTLTAAYDSQGRLLDYKILED
jgi:YD repeat-containing protein